MTNCFSTASPLRWKIQKRQTIPLKDDLARGRCLFPPRRARAPVIFKSQSKDVCLTCSEGSTESSKTFQNLSLFLKVVSGRKSDQRSWHT